jgi:hypothetical protein
MSGSRAASTSRACRRTLAYSVRTETSLGDAAAAVAKTCRACTRSPSAYVLGIHLGGTAQRVEGGVPVLVAERKLVQIEKGPLVLRVVLERLLERRLREGFLAAQGIGVPQEAVGVAGLRIDLEEAVGGRLSVQRVAAGEGGSAEGEVVRAGSRRRGHAAGRRPGAGGRRRRRLRDARSGRANLRGLRELALLLVGLGKEVERLGVELLARHAVKEVVDDVVGVAVGELLSRDALEFGDVGHRRRQGRECCRANLARELDELGREKVGHDLEVGAARERAAERLLGFGSLRVVEVRPGRLDEHARPALGIARRGSGALELQRRFPELAGVDGLPRLLFERLRAFLCGKRAAQEKQDRGGREKHAHAHAPDCSYSFFSSMAGRT